MPRGGAIALSPQNPLTEQIKSKLQSKILFFFTFFFHIFFPFLKLFYLEYPLAPTVIFFDSLDQMNAHVESNYYGSTSYPYLCFGVAFTSSGTYSCNQKYEYNIRFNVSRGKSDVYNTDKTITSTTIPFVKYKKKKYIKF